MSQIKESDLDQIGGGMRLPVELGPPVFIPDLPIKDFPVTDLPCPLPYPTPTFPVDF